MSLDTKTDKLTRNGVFSNGVTVNSWLVGHNGVMVY